MIPAVKCIPRPVDIDLIHVVVGVKIIYTALLGKLYHRVVQTYIITLRGDAAVQHQLYIILPAIIERQLKQKLLPAVDRIDFLIRVPVMRAACIRNALLVDQISFEILADPGSFQPVLPNIVVLDERNLILEKLGKEHASETDDTLVLEQIVGFPEYYLDRLPLRGLLNVKERFQRLLQVPSHIVCRIAVVAVQLHGRHADIAQTVADIKYVDLSGHLRVHTGDPGVTVCYIALFHPFRAVKKI